MKSVASRCVVIVLLSVLLPIKGAYAAEPVSGTGFKIAEHDPSNGLVTAHDAQGGVIQFTVSDPALLRNVKVGQTVVPDFAKQTVAITVEVPFEIVSGAARVNPAEPVGRPQVDPAEPVGGTMAEPAEPVNQPAMDPAEPVNDIQARRGAGCRQGSAATAGENASGGPATQPAGKALTSYSVKPNPQLKGRLGRLVIQFPKDAPASNTRYDVYSAREPEKSINGGYGSATLDLMPGEYSVSIGTKRIEKVPVTSRNDTQVRSGVLRITAGSDTRVDVLDPQGNKLVGGYGDMEVGLPIGSYQVEIAGQRDQVEITDGKITQF